METTRHDRVSSFTTLMVILTGLITLPVINGYVLDLARLPLDATTTIGTLGLEILAAGIWAGSARQTLRWSQSARMLGVALTFFTFLFLGLLMGWPSFLPVSGSVDPVHHYDLIDYIFQHQGLVHDASEGRNLGEMVAYPFAASLLVALAAKVSQVPAILLMDPIASLIVAYTATYLYATVTELVADTLRAHLTALVIIPIFLWPITYTFEIYFRTFFLPQMLGIACLLGLWFWLVYFQRTGDRRSFGMMVLLATTVIFSYSTLLPPFVLSFAVAPWLQQRRPSVRRWLADCAMVGLPLLVVVGLYLRSQIGAGLSLLSAVGSAPYPTTSTLTSVLLVCTILGLVYSTAYRRYRAAASFVWFSVLQTAGLFMAYYFLSNVSSYHVQKTVYVLAPEFVAVACLVIVDVLGSLTKFDRVTARPWALGAPFAVALLASFYSARVWLGEFPKIDPRPSVIEPLTPDDLVVATWAKINLPHQSIAYLANRRVTVDWIHVGILREPRDQVDNLSISPVTPRDYVKWFTVDASNAYAFVTAGLPELVGPESEVVFRQGDAGIVRRRAGGVPPVVPKSVGELIFREATIPSQFYHPGDTMTVAVNLAALDRLSHPYYVQARLVDWRDQTVAQASQPLSPFDDVVRVPSGHPFDVKLPLPVPPSVDPGMYRIQLVFFDDAWVTIPITGTNDQSDTVTVGPFLAASNVDLPTAVRPSTPLDLYVGDDFRVVGADLSLIQANGVSTALYWQAQRKPGNDYTIFVQLLDSSGKLVAQRDAFPWDGGYPTSSWSVGQLVHDRYHVSLPTDLPPGTYKIIAGAYLRETMTRLPVTDARHMLVGDHISLGDITVPNPN